MCICNISSEERIAELVAQCGEEGRRRGEGEGGMRREKERAEDLERQLREARDKEEGLCREINAITEVKPHPPLHHHQILIQLAVLVFVL